MSLMVSPFGNQENISVTASMETKSLTVQLDQVIKAVTDKHKEDILRGNIVYRCENLPEVEGIASGYYIVFNHLLSIILSNRDAFKPGFLYVNCVEAEQDPEVMDLTLKKGSRKFAINLSTSFQLSPGWSDKFQAEIQQSIELLLMNKGNLQIYSERTTGCLFTVLLPGKQL